MKNKTKIVTGRFRSIDGMRGVAALGVVVYHMSLNLEPDLSHLLPDVINIIFSYGFLGVPIFFVISGFVISLSVGDSRISLNYTGQFILRRSVRLDPTYWVAIAIAITLMMVKNQFLNISEPLPSFSHVLVHMFYLQDLLEIKPTISVIYWTLCLEVQLYLFYIFTLWASQIITVHKNKLEYFAHVLLVIVVGIYSLSLEHKLTSLNIPGLFIPFWHYFLLGVLVSNVVRKLPYSSHVLVAWLILEIAFQAGIDIKAFSIGGIVTSIFIYILWIFNSLDKAFTNRGYQFLGKISYTLYLIHPDVGWKTISVGKLILEDYMSPILAGVLFISGIIVSIVCAYLLHIGVERPSLWLCSRLKKSSLREIFIEFMRQNSILQYRDKKQ